MSAKRGRPIGSKETGLPACPQHPGSSVTLADRYGKDKSRQRFRCRPANGEPQHRFVDVVPHLVARGHICAHCNSAVPAHRGPAVARDYSFPVEQAAAALVMVGQGVSYSEAAQRIRVAAHKTSRSVGAQLVANWVEVLGPVVSASLREREWPETVVLDSTNFVVTNSRTGERSQAFAVLGAYGYEVGVAKGRLWALSAKHRHREAQWKELLTSLPGEPVLVIADDDPAIHNAVAAVWPNAFVKLCEHHLFENARKQMRTYGQAGYASEGMKLLRVALKSPADWRRFRRWAKDFAGVDAWAQSLDATILDQAKRRAKLPQHHSTGALDPLLAKVRALMKPRAFCYRNAVRTNRMLELVRLRLNLADDPDRYAAAIREHLAANGGWLGAQGVVRDPKGHYSLRV